MCSKRWENLSDAGLGYEHRLRLQRGKLQQQWDLLNQKLSKLEDKGS